MFKVFLIDLFEEIKNNIFVVLFFAYSFLTRFILFIFAYFLKEVELNKVFEVFLIGLFNDFITCLYGLVIILTARLLFSPLFKNQKAGQILSFFSFISLNAIFLFNLIGEIAFWDEYQTRYNFIAVDYLIYTNEIIGTLKESVPVTAIISAYVFLLLLITILFRKYVSKIRNQNKPLSISILVFSLLSAGLCNQIYDSEKFMLSKNSFVRELSKNGIYEFVFAFFHNELDYKKFYPLIDSAEADKLVRNMIKQDGDKFINEKGIERHVSGKNILKRNLEKPNYIVIIVESLSAEYLGVFGNKENITPYLDKISKEGILFTKAYATGTRTVRGLEAVVKSIPPTPGSSILRRQNNEDLFTVATVLKPLGYAVDFIFGGYSYFDNMKYFFSHNGFDVIDRNDFSKDEISFANVWGIADGDAFNKGIKAIDSRFEEGKPFFSLFVTTTNHRPYTFPENTIDMPQGSRSSVVRYTDYAIEHFIEDAKTKPWFKDTIFVIVADHCASSAGKAKLPVNKYHIPLIIYAPDLIKPAKIDYLVSQIDTIPTLLGLNGMSYQSKFYGIDALKSAPNRAFISTYQLLGYLKDDGLVILAPNKDPITEVNSKSENNDYIDQAISYYLNSYESFKEEQMK